MAGTIRQSGMKEVALSEVEDNLARYLREAETEEIVITRDGKPAGVLIGFESDEDWIDYCLEREPHSSVLALESRTNRSGQDRSMSSPVDASQRGGH
jgi:prevent-host-death family protein